MKTAVISDIHGHWTGLEIVLRDIASRNVDRIVCLGDLVEGGDYNDKVVEFIRTSNIVTVRGNHDVVNNCQIKPDNQSWLDQLPEYLLEEDVFFTHLFPRMTDIPIDNCLEAWNVFEDTHYRLCFIGHIHFPAMFGAQSDLIGEACSYPVDFGKYQLDKTDRYIISFGAVGYPRGGGKFLRYGIFDSTTNQVEFIRLTGPLLMVNG
jgi:predicted phosphodiesterase